MKEKKRLSSLSFCRISRERARATRSPSYLVRSRRDGRASGLRAALDKGKSAVDAAVVDVENVDFIDGKGPRPDGIIVVIALALEDRDADTNSDRRLKALRSCFSWRRGNICPHFHTLSLLSQKSILMFFFFFDVDFFLRERKRKKVKKSESKRRRHTDVFSRFALSFTQSSCVQFFRLFPFLVFFFLATTMLASSTTRVPTTRPVAAALAAAAAVPKVAGRKVAAVAAAAVPLTSSSASTTLMKKRRSNICRAEPGESLSFFVRIFCYNMMHSALL